jgi:AraC-like DNA-binding protein
MTHLLVNSPSPNRASTEAPRRLLVKAREFNPLIHPEARLGEEGQVYGDSAGSEDETNGLVPLTEYFRLTREHAALSREESLGLAPRPLVNGTTDFVMAQAGLGDTLADAMRNMARAYNTLHVGEYNFVETNERACMFRVDDAAFPYTRPADASVTLMLECVLIYLHSALSSVAGEDLTPLLRGVATRRQQPSLHNPLDFWTCTVEYGAPSYAIVYAPEVARHAIVRAPVSESTVYNRTLDLIERREAEFQPIFAPLVRRALQDGARDQDEAARRVGVSVATLRRKLNAEGHSFRSLRQEHLNQAAKLGLLHAERVAEIAEKLGFSDPRSFSRAFKGWNGLTPGSFKTNYRSDT